jgi:DNA-binding MarR family transcriptional regulator
MENHNLSLTPLETQVLECLIDNLYAEPGFSDVDANDISKQTKIPTTSIRGVLSSLVKKGIIQLDENYSNFVIIYLNEQYWYLHPTWKNEA